MSFTVVPEDAARQLADPGSQEACPHCGQHAFWRNGSYGRHLLLLGSCRVQCWRCQTCGRTHSRLPERGDPPAAHASLAGNPDVPVSAGRQPACGLRQLGTAGLFRESHQPVAGCAAAAGGGAVGYDREATRVVLLDETWLPLEGWPQPVAVVLDSEGQPRGAGFQFHRCQNRQE